jgi:hypothetical protein
MVGLPVLVERDAGHAGVGRLGRRWRVIASALHRVNPSRLRWCHCSII